MGKKADRYSNRGGGVAGGREFLQNKVSGWKCEERGIDKSIRG